LTWVNVNDKLVIENVKKENVWIKEILHKYPSDGVAVEFTAC